MMSPKGKIRVVVVDDSPTVRDLIVAVLQGSEDIQVVGTAENGEDAIRIARRMKPDLITMDINMPKLDGLEATKRIMAETPTPIIVISGSLMRTEVELTFDALQAGALTAIRTPGLADPQACDQLIKVVQAMSKVPVVRRWNYSAKSPSTPPQRDVAVPVLGKIKNQTIEVVGIASSTGGPGVLASILKTLPVDFPVPILVVQHITQGFGTGLADWLNGETKLQVRLARHGDSPEPGTVLLAPDDYHMQLNSAGLVELVHGKPYRSIRPSANYLFRSLAQFYGASAMGIILTGMGDDGADGMEELYRAGGITLAQDEKSCVVFGMPREAIIRKVVDRVLPPEQIGYTLARLAENNGQ